eukprot:2957464-Ditylum_brightwellii.AAC.1
MANEDENSLAIRAFEVAFYMGMGATYIYEICEEIIEKLKCAKAYQDGGLAMFLGNRWLEIWKPPGDVEIPNIGEEEDTEGGIPANGLKK